MSEIYYNDPDQWGQYQFVTLEQLVTDYLMSRDQDDYTAKVPRNKLLYKFRKAFQEFNYDILQEIKVKSLDLNPDTLSVVLPSDYVNYVRISYVDDKGMLQAIDKNDKLSIATEYLQDHEYQILFDESGCPLQDSDGYLNKLKSQERATLNGEPYDRCYFFNQSYQFQPNRKMGNVFVNGYFKIDKNRGIIQFDPSVGGKQIVLEYISDGLSTGCLGLPEEKLRVHKFAEEAVIDKVYYELIKQIRNVPANEKARARKEYFNSKRNAKRRLNTLRRNELIQAYKSQSRWMKT